MALEETVRRLAPGLLRFCRGNLDDPSLAEDVAQEALSALVARWRRHGPPDDPAAFAYAIARRRLRRAAWKRRLTLPWTEAQEPATMPAAEADLDAKGRLDRVRGHLTRLSNRERQALLVSLDGLSSRQCAAVLGVGDSAFKMRLHRARLRLRKLMEESDATP